MEHRDPFTVIKRPYRGDAQKGISIKLSTYNQLKELSKQTNCTLVDLIDMMLVFCSARLVIKEEK
jgi:hypothetical protein